MKTEDFAKFQDLYKQREQLEQELDKFQKWLTVSFVDIVGSTRYFEEHGDVAGMVFVQNCMDLLSPIAEKHGGTICKTIGDALMTSYENPTEAVCDVTPPDLGGVPGISPPRLDDSFETCARLNDLGCRFVDGSGMTLGRSCNSDQSCVRFDNGEFGCVAPDATVQFCGFVARTIEFPLGDTLISVRARDSQGNLGPVAQMIVRVE